MAKVKITAAQIIALRSATMRDNGSYELTTAKGQTVNALTRMGIVVSGTRFLTVQGVSVMHTVRDVSVIASKGHTTYVSDSPESLEMFTLPERESESVEIQGDDPSNWTPDFLAPGARECYFGCGRDVAAVFVTHVGVTEGLCEAHRERVEGRTYELPNAETVAPQILAHARQSLGKDVTTGEPLETKTVEDDSMDNTTNNGEPFVFVPGTHALDMGTNSYNRFVGIGESMGVAGSMYTFGLATAISAHPGMNGTGQSNIPCEFGDVITVRTSLGDKRYVVSDNRYSATGPRKGDPILTPYALDDVRCTRCETHGDNSMPGKNIGGEWVCGYCVENTESDDSAREFPCFKRMGVVTHKGECSETRNENGPVCSLESDHTGNRDCALCVGADTRFMTDAEKRASFACVEKAQEKQDAAFQEMVNAPESDWMYRANGLDDDSDAGFVETESTDDYAIVSRLSTGAGFHTVTDAPVSTGTTHHTMDTHGGQWERFEHVLSVGDIVRSTETGRALYEVYALIPGLPVVYVDPCDGRAPFPVGATKLYAL